MRRAEFVLDEREGLIVRERRHVVLQLAQLGDDVLGDEVRARRSHLPELHERRAEALEREAQAHGERLALLALGAQARRDGLEPAQTGLSSRSSKPSSSSTPTIWRYRSRCL